MRLAIGWGLACMACVAASPSPATVSLAAWEKKWKEGEKATGRGNIFIRCEPEDAEILLEGIPQGSCADYASLGLQINESPALKKLVVTKAGYWPYEAMLSLDRSKINLRVQLQPMQTSVGPSNSTQ